MISSHSDESEPMDDLHRVVEDLRARLTQLEPRIIRLKRQQPRRKRLNQKESAEYIGKSRETLRLASLSGRIKRRADGDYDIDALDEYLAQGR